MLRELHISNLAVIEDVTIELGEGFNCFTGQTGAGKSLVLGAFEILLGLRGGVTEMLRPGAEEARVSGVFELHDAWIAKQVSQALDVTLEPGEQLLITRKFFASGRSSVSVNGQPATASMVRAIGELLVDIHGQHDHQYLLKPSNQLLILDSFAKAMEQREKFGQLHGEIRDLIQRRAELQASRTLRKQQLELYEFQADEIDKAQLVAGEFEELKARHSLLTNLEKVKRETSLAFNALYESEGSILERLNMVSHIVAGLAEVDPRLAEVAENIRTSAMTLQDAAFELGRHTERTDLDPAELGEVEDRLNTLNRLAAKYAGGAGPGTDIVAEILAFRAQIGGQIEQLRGQDEDLSSLSQRVETLRKELAVVGEQLTKARKAAAQKIKPLVEVQMRELGMGEAGFEVEFLPVPATEEAGSASGLETVEMLVRTNPGQPARPLRKIASGGELSRIMLALKSILAQSDRVSVLVFDEIDANIGGRMGTVIGDKLRRLAHGTPNAGKKPRMYMRCSAQGAQQVLCITHLPQIAAFADRHLRIAKSVDGTGKQKQTRTTVTVLKGPDRVEELAEMLAGKDVSDTTRKQVQEMLVAAGA
jgi:DNA repair protein RecN (Recombination protein N)